MEAVVVQGLRGGRGRLRWAFVDLGAFVLSLLRALARQEIVPPPGVEQVREPSSQSN